MIPPRPRRRPLRRPGAVFSGSLGPTNASQANLRQVATRSYLNNQTGFNTGSTGIMGQQMGVLQDDIFGIIPVFCNWHIDGATGLETASGNTMQIRCGFGSNSSNGGTIVQALFSGAAQGSVASGGTLFGDMVPFVRPRGTVFYSRVQQLNAAGVYYINQRATSSIGDRLTFDSTDKSISGAIADDTSGYAYGPNLILGIGRRRSVFVVGDSRAFGLGDTPDTTGDQGIARSLGPTNAYAIAGAPSLTATAFAASNTRTAALAQYFTDILWDIGTNDLDGGSEAASQAAMLACYAAFAGVGHRQFVKTLDPLTSPAWSLADGSDQTSITRNFTARNTFLKGTVANVDGYFDVAPSVSLLGNSQKWHAGYTTDGAHADQAGELARLAANGATIQAAFA